MRIKQPEPFLFEAGPRAVLLLHGFTGHSADVRMLGRYLEKKGYTSYAPIFRGHGRPPEQLIRSNPDQWWEDVEKAYHFLQDEGYEEIAVAGLSLGGVLGLKLAYSKQIKGVVPMCAPMHFNNMNQLTQGFKMFSKQYKQLERKNDQTIERELQLLMEESEPLFTQINSAVSEVKNQIDTIYTPTMVVQARKDEMIDPQSANYIYENVEADIKKIKWYEESGHVITLDKEKDKLHDDIYTFLDTLDWAQ